LPAKFTDVCININASTHTRIYIYNERAQNKSDRIHTTVEYAGKFFIQKKREREINFSC